MKSILLIFFLFNFLILINSIQTQKTSRYYSYEDEAYIWNLIDNLTGTNQFGWSVSIYENVTVVGSPYVNQAFIYRYNGTNFELEQTLNGTESSNFGFSVSVYENVTVVGAYGSNKTYIYRYNGSIWNLEQTLNGTEGSKFGWSVSIYEDVIVIGAWGENKTYIYRYNGSIWNLEQILNGTEVTNFGGRVLVYENVTVVGAHLSDQLFIYRYNGTVWNLEQNFTGTPGSKIGWGVSVYENVLVVGAPGSGQVFIYRYNESIWNLEQNFTGTSGSYFGWSVSVYENVLVIGAYWSNKAFIYRYNGSIWNLEKTLNGPDFFGWSVSVYENFTAIGSTFESEVYVYQFTFIPQVNLHNCSSLFSSFDCYWDQIQIPNLKYQINFGYDWIDIDSPILKDGNVLYQLFNSSFNSNITGNEYYTIQIQVCDIESLKCGEVSSFVNLTTKIDSVKDFQLVDSTFYSVNASWNYPNVVIDGGIPHLDHYNFSYFNTSAPGSITSTSIDNSSTSYLFDIECGNDYNVSIFGCRTPECEAEDQGEVVESSISIPFENIENLGCLVSVSLKIFCSWTKPNNCKDPSYYNFTYQAISGNDSENYHLGLGNKEFIAKIPNQEYQINVSACNSMNKCGNISTTSVTTGNLTTSPTINQAISKIEEIELNFTKVSNANNYSISISLNNETNWQNFTSLDLSGSEGIGRISGISGNIEYNISVCGCIDLKCEIYYLGDPSSFTLETPKLGNITSLDCYGIVNAFFCSWDSLNLTDGLKGYLFRYNSIMICLSSSINYQLISGVNGGENYDISVYASADSNCYYNEYSGISSNTSVSPSLPTQTKESASKTPVIVMGVVIPILVIASIIGFIILIKKQKKSIKRIIKEREKELEKSGGIEMI
ncbi:hypothetical protein M0811_12604 [Anaeramoeba ignava]|uniref:Fibronectin type-III domain-containing protein n=1 Tax=Anaeramoeba ignava TaxID=1746090 RepID=A0A9Q0R6W8_ANAIG|nr:hypothetical protein M0811_12604 [Anaeramoeba ignava]